MERDEESDGDPLDGNIAASPASALIAVTLADVARLAGVGESTVSRVLRGRGSSSARTRTRVMAAVEALGYVPNRVAGTLASAGSNLVGIVIPSLANIVFPDLLLGANGALEAAGLQAVIGVTDYVAEREEALIASMLAWRPQGLILTGLEHTTRALAMIRASGVRVAELLDIDGADGGQAAKQDGGGGIDIVVGYSHRAVGRASARFIVGRGHCRVGYVGHDLSRDLRAAKRRAGFVEGLAEVGLSLHAEEIVALPSSIAVGRDALGALLERAGDLDAVYFSNDDMAVGGLFHCTTHGISVPGRLAVMGCNGLDIALHAPQPLATVLTPRVAIGRIGATLLAGRARGQVIDVGFELIEGATV